MSKSDRYTSRIPRNGLSVSRKISRLNLGEVLTTKASRCEGYGYLVDELSSTNGWGTIIDG